MTGRAQQQRRREGRGGAEEKTVVIEFVRGKVYSRESSGHLQTPERGRRDEFGKRVRFSGK